MNNRIRHQIEIREASAQVRKFILIGLSIIYVPVLAFVGWRLWSERVPADLPEIGLVQGQNLLLAAASLRPRQAMWFTYPTSSDRLRLVVQRDEAWRIRVAYGTCKMCYTARATHEWISGQLICGRCRQVMRLADPGEEITPAKGCIAVPVPFRSEGGKIVVQAKDIERHLEDLQSVRTSGATIK